MLLISAVVVIVVHLLFIYLILKLKNKALIRHNEV